MNRKERKGRKRLINYFLAFLASFAVNLILAYADTIPEKVQKGAELLESGDLEGARTILKEVLQENPRHGPAHLLLGQIAMREFEWKQAQEHLEIATVSGSRRPHLAWQLLGKLHLLQHDYTRAKEYLDRSLQESSDYSPALLDRARANLFLGNTEGALQDLQKTDSAEAKVLLAQVLIHLNRIKEANEVLQTITGKSEAAKWLLQALNKNEENKLKASLGENLGQADAFSAVAIRYRLNGKTDYAERLFRIAFHLNDQNAAYLLFLKNGKDRFAMPHPLLQHKISVMRRLLEQKNWNDAERISKEVLASSDHCVPAYLILSEIAEERGDFWEALAQQRKIVNWLPEVPTVQARFATLTRSMGAYELARCGAQKALAIQPDNGSLYYLLATILEAQEKTEAAIQSCRKAIDLGFRKAAVYVTLGNLHYQKMELSESIQAMATAVELDPLAAEDIAAFALSALTTEQYANLRALLEKHVAAHPQNINTLYSLGVIYLNENQLEKARSYFLQLEKLAPRYSQVYYNLALLHSREGKEEEARVAMRRFQQLKSEEQQDWLKHNQAHGIRLQAEDFMKEGKADKAIVLYSRLVSDELAELADLLALGRAHQTAGNHAEAFSTFERILQRYPYNEDAIQGLIASSEKLGKKAATQMYQEKLQLLSGGNDCR